MKSMTGFAFKDISDSNYRLTCEIKSVNNRYLDVQVHLPPQLGPLEPNIRDAVSTRCKRGRVDVSLDLALHEEPVSVYFDRQQLTAYRDMLLKMRDCIGSMEDLELDHFLAFKGIIKTEQNHDFDEYWQYIKQPLEEALAEFDETRTREGFHTHKDILEQFEIIRENTVWIKKHQPDMERTIRENFEKRMNELVEIEYDKDRVLTEIGVMLVKYGINEEVNRLESHLSNFTEIIQTDGAIGKKLDFLSQEFNREINTIGSKSISAEVNTRVVRMKDALENIREQLRNVE